MQDFLDSTDLIGDGPALAERLRRDGYLFLRGVLPREAVLEVRGRLLEKAAAGGWLDPARPRAEGIANPDAACKDPEERYMAVFRGIWADEALHRLPQGEQLEAALVDLEIEVVSPNVVIASFADSRSGATFEDVQLSNDFGELNRPISELTERSTAKPA